MLAKWWLSGVLCILPQTLCAQTEFFEMKIRPVLARNCFTCHTNSELGGLRLDSAERMLKGGKSGPAIVPGNSSGSLLIQAVEQTHSRLKMPPQAKLTAEELADLRKWVDGGAAWPAQPAVKPLSKPAITAEQRGFWSFQPVRKPAVPQPKSRKWAKTAIDRMPFTIKEGPNQQPVMVTRAGEFSVPEISAIVLDYVHNIDYSSIAADAVLAREIEKLPGRKLVFTAGTVAHATRAMDRLGVTHLFDDIYDIIHADYVPKPQREPYDGFLKAHNVNPKNSAFFEDIARNLEVPHALGMVTVLVKSAENKDANHLNEGSDGPHVHHVTEHLAGFLSDVNKSGR